MMVAEKMSLPGLIAQGHYNRSELHGYEVDLSGRVIVPEFHPRTPDEVSSHIKFEAELLSVIDVAA